MRLYRDDWHQSVAARRVQSYRDTRDRIEQEDKRIRYLTALIEQLRETQDYVTLATVYDDMDNVDLRDKYIGLALERDSPDWLVIDLRSMQERRDLIPDDVVERRLARQGEIGDWNNRARTLVKLGRQVDGAHDYVKAILEGLENGKLFFAAFYLKELSEKGLIDYLFEKALEKASEENDLWWQVRSLQELGWDSELDELLLANEDEIEESGNLLLKSYLLFARGDEEEADKAFIEYSALRKVYDNDGRVILLRDDDPDEVDLSDDIDTERYRNRPPTMALGANARPKTY